MIQGGLEEVCIAVTGGDIHCVFAGPDDATTPALLLLHGWTLDHRMWAPQLAAFASGRLVLAPDRRGFGVSSAPPDLGRETDDLVAILDRFAVQSAIIVGMSQAGRVAIDFALHFHERVCGLVLQGAPASGVTPGPDEDETIPVVEYAALARAGRLDEVKRRWRLHPLMHTSGPIAALIVEAMLESYAGRDLGATNYLRDSEPRDLAQIEAPALVITGTLDAPWRRRAGDGLARALANAKRVEIEGGGHLCNLDEPKAFNEAMASFIARVGG